MDGFHEIVPSTLVDKKSSKPIIAFKLRKRASIIKNHLTESAKSAFVDIKSQQKDTINKSSCQKLFKEYEQDNEISKESLCLKHSYREPSWGFAPKDIYKLEVLKSGTILTTLHLYDKSFYTIGSSLHCDICLTHETVSPFHAVLQFKQGCDFNESVYIYDMKSVHGTHVNGSCIESNEYFVLRGGFILSFGKSQRKYVLCTPTENAEKESELTSLELQELKAVELQEQLRIEKEIFLRDSEKSMKQENEARAINWGIIEDEYIMEIESLNNSDSDNEDLYLKDPQKALRDWFKWEGYDLEYHTEDEGFGRYSCYVLLTLDTVGTTEKVVVNVKGDKTKAINECAMKACRILSKYGFLQQAKEEKESITRNWKETDYYDSDDDNFLDRTGTVERKRQQRLQTDVRQNDLNDEIYKSLLKKHSEITDKIKDLEKTMSAQTSSDIMPKISNEEDILDSFMATLHSENLSKSEKKNMKIELNNLHQHKMLINDSIKKCKNTKTFKNCTLSISEKTSL